MAGLPRPNSGHASVGLAVLVVALMACIAILSQGRLIASRQGVVMHQASQNSMINTERETRALTQGGAAPDDVNQRCALTKGDWCRAFYQQQPIPAKPPTTGTKPCLWGCNRVGVCDGLAGWCRCPAGWKGDACDERMKRPCSQFWRTEADGLEPSTSKNDFSVDKPMMLIRCAGYCDEDIGMCFCNSTTPHGRLPPPPGSLPGTKPLRFGRQQGDYCHPNANPETGEPSKFGTRSLEELYGPEGWCTADKPKHTCGCPLDGVAGPACETHHEAFCVNQCNGHGDCYLGWCQCDEGWFGHDCAYRQEGVPWSPGREAEQPWLAEHVHTPAAMPPKPGATRLRPLIYIYELPPRFNQHMLQYRVIGDMCVHRQFNERNGTVPIGYWYYAIETALHEYLAQSPHRTLDPEEADYFYMPVYVTCYAQPVHGWGDFPWFHGGNNGGFRSTGMTNMFIEAWSWVRSHHPYWDRRGGRDHIIVSPHDEGSCFVPDVMRSSILLTHWGRTDLNHTSETGYWQDNYSTNYTHPLWQPEGNLPKLGHHPCYYPDKDLVLPLVWPPSKYEAAPLFGTPARARQYLGMFKGRIQPGNLKYSRGVRQLLANLSSTEQWFERHRVHIGEKNPPGVELSYSELLASSVFCFVLMGDGWSARFDDAIINGCIPVVVMDGIHASFEGIMQVESFSLRIDAKDAADIPRILEAVPAERVAELQRNIGRVWRRFMYSGLRSNAAVVRRYLRENAKRAAGAPPPLSQPAPEGDYDPEQDDAFATIVQWLYGRIPHTR